MIGGGGEQFTLRIAAKHAASWNYYGSVDVMTRKLDVLRGHCERVDRPFDDIEKSWFGRCVIGETDREVETLLEAAPRFRPDRVDDGENHLVGTPAEVCEQLRPYVELGFDEVVVEFVDFPRTDGLELFADEVVPNV
jgi:alkanesulfonate monooxygenase SsuD/methylene tetrahydromethanopterin reductase-like flavin-dependent oxidoreductase (luciferase family)